VKSPHDLGMLGTGAQLISFGQFHQQETAPGAAVFLPEFCNQGGKLPRSNLGGKRQLFQAHRARGRK
jgi:hypothetical protein